MTEEATNPNNLSNFAGASHSEKAGIKVQQVEVTGDDGGKIMSVSEKIYNKGNALKFMVKTCQRSHIDDENIIKALILSYAGTLVNNNEIGINVRISGEPGSGKSHVADTVKKIIPKDYMLSGRLTDAAPLYLARGELGLKQGSIIYADDQSLSPKAAEIMKAQTSDINAEFCYYTVINNKTEKLTIPPRCIRWSALADSTGDEQTADRELFFFVDESEEHLKRIWNLKIKKNKNPGIIKTNKKIEDIARAIWRHIPKDNTIQIPFIDEIDIDIHERNRNQNLFESLIRASAVLHAPKRGRTPEGYIIADEKDFDVAAEIMNPILKGKGGSQSDKLTKQQQRILDDFFLMRDSGRYTFREIKNVLKIGHSEFSKAIYGRDEYGHNSDGLLKIPGIHPTMTENSREKCIDWDKETYHRWKREEGGFRLRHRKDKTSDTVEPIKND